MNQETLKKTFPPTSSCASPSSPKAGQSSSNSAQCLTSITASRCRFSMWRRTTTSFSITPVAASAPVPLATSGSGSGARPHRSRRRRAGPPGHGRRPAVELASRLPGRHHPPRRLCGRDSQLEPQLRLRRQAAGHWLKRSRECAKTATQSTAQIAKSVICSAQDDNFCSDVSG